MFASKLSHHSVSVPWLVGHQMHFRDIWSSYLYFERGSLDSLETAIQFQHVSISGFGQNATQRLGCCIAGMAAISRVLTVSEIVCRMDVQDSCSFGVLKASDFYLYILLNVNL